ncbi:hypothetical protein QZH41_007345 [Actinostola sp. cb2023]|nr:hypothetical protein QZH41_007345 [Actinostola sp. cb2023]
MAAKRKAVANQVYGTFYQNSQPLVLAQLIASVVDALKAPLASMVEQAVHSARMSPGQAPSTRDNSCEATPSLSQSMSSGSGAFGGVPSCSAANTVTGQNTTTDEPEPELLFDGRLVLTNTAKKIKCKIRDIITWMEAFTIYMMIVCSYFPHRWSDLTKYKLLIVRTFRQFGGQGWLNYDREFRETAAAERLTDWSNMNVQLYNFNTAGAPVRPRLLSSNLSSSTEASDNPSSKQPAGQVPAVPAPQAPPAQAPPAQAPAARAPPVQAQAIPAPQVASAPAPVGQNAPLQAEANLPGDQLEALPYAEYYVWNDSSTRVQ